MHNVSHLAVCCLRCKWLPVAWNRLARQYKLYQQLFPGQLRPSQFRPFQVEPEWSHHCAALARRYHFYRIHACTFPIWVSRSSISQRFRFVKSANKALQNSFSQSWFIAAVSMDYGSSRHVVLLLVFPVLRPRLFVCQRQHPVPVLPDVSRDAQMYFDYVRPHIWLRHKRAAGQFRYLFLCAHLAHVP